MTRILAAAGWFALGFLACGLLFTAGAWGHEAPAGWSYDPACCSNRDCAPLPDGSVEEVPGGFVLKSSGEFIPFKETRQGKDDQFHICINELTNVRLCFYRKYSGS